MQEEGIKRIWKSWMRKKTKICEKKEIAWSFLSFLENFFILPVYIFYCRVFSPQIQSPELKEEYFNTKIVHNQGEQRVSTISMGYILVER